ncbi:uncharacterized protein LKV04_004544 [Tautogolabrus adspersus]
MEQDGIAGLYRSLGLSVGAEFSSDHVSLLFQKVFHVPSNTDEAIAAMEKIAGGDKSWCCVGENVLDVLLEMEREREKKDELYWDLQLLNVGNLNTLYVTDKSVVNDPHRKELLHQSMESNTFRKAHNQSEPDSFHPGSFGTQCPQRERLMGNKEQCGSVRGVKRLKKAARQCWAKLVSEGLQSIFPSSTPGESPAVRCQAWGFVSLSDVLVLVEEKYDVVTQLLYTEMLQEHYTLSIWETLPLLQQHKEEEQLEHLAEEALELGDMLSLSELPGAFRIYRAYLGPSREETWSAVSFLYELHTFRQQEKDALTVLCKRLDRDALRLICLYIRLATLRAQRENMSYNALPAARQSWETWPHVKSPCRAEQVALWLHGEEEKQKKDLISESPQQAVLQLLVLTQEQERKHLIKSQVAQCLKKKVHRYNAATSFSKVVFSPKIIFCFPYYYAESPEQFALRNNCLTRLRQIYADLQAQNETMPTSNQTNPQPQLQIDHLSSKFEKWSQQQLEDCSLLLLAQMMELHEVRASTLLPALMDKSPHHVQALRDKYEYELQAQSFTLQLQISEARLTSVSMISPGLNFTENSSNQQITADGSCRSEPVDAQNSSSGPGKAPMVDPIRGGSRELHAVQAADETDKQDVCIDCGAIMEDLPYLEILCVSDETSNPHQPLATEGGTPEGDKGREMKSTQCIEKQGSLIALAWSKPSDDDCEAEAADEDRERSQEPESSLKTQVEPTEIDHSTEETSPSEHNSRESDREEVKPTMNQFVSTGFPGEKVLCLSNKHQIIIPQIRIPYFHNLTSKERVFPDQFEKGEGISHMDTAVVQVEMCPTETDTELWDLRGPEPAFNSQATVDSSPAGKEEIRESSLLESERAGESVSAVERERTMRNLVDMQRKVEQRQQRDRERQLLRVQKRLSIIQNRKAEEDLLGLKHTDRLKHLTQDLPQEDKNQQKTIVRERLEQLRRERSYVMQSKRERNTAGFQELLGPVALQSRETNDGAD